MPSLPQRRSPRPPPDAYREEGRVFSVTIGTSPRQPIFSDLGFGHACIDELGQLRDDLSVPVYAYCLMPDHVHLLLAVTRTHPLPGIIQQWKSRCYQIRRRCGNAVPFWQRSFHDHALRRDADLRTAAKYILDNPVRAGIVDARRAYPLSGSFEWTLDRLS